MLKKLTLQGLHTGFRAGIVISFFDGLYMLVHAHAPYSYPVLLIIFNTIFWSLVGTLSGFALWLYVSKRENILFNEGYYRCLFFLVPFTILYGLLSKLFIPIAFGPIKLGGTIPYDHHLSFVWVGLTLFFLCGCLWKKIEIKPSFFSLEIVAYVTLFTFCSNLLFLKVPFVYTKAIDFFQKVSIGQELFLSVVYISGVIIILTCYLLGCFIVRPRLKRIFFLYQVKGTAMLFCIVCCCLGGFATWNHFRNRPQLPSTWVAPVNQHNPPSPNVILIVLDTVRADRLSIYNKTGPGQYLHDFSKEALVFDNCIASSSWTLPSHASLFTGLYPVEHGCHVNLDTDKKKWNGECQPLAQRFITLAEIFQENGYATSAVISNELLLMPDFKLGQGLQTTISGKSIGDLYRNYPFKPILHLFCFLTQVYHKYAQHYRTADDITDDSLALVEAMSPSSFFFLANYMDAHTPYFPPRPFNGFFLDKPYPYLYRMQIKNFRTRDKISPETYNNYLLSQYDGEIAYIDNQLQRFFNRLKKMRLYDSALIIITSDHGELFGEHGFYMHRSAIYQGVARVPLIIKYPFSTRVGREKKIITLSDLFATILSLCDLPLPEYVSGKAFGNNTEPAVSEFFDYQFGTHRALYDGKYKYMQFEKQRETELYDLEQDPNEQNNLAIKMPGLSRAMERKLNNWLKTHPPLRLSPSKKNSKISPEVLKELKALGYIQ